jgi:hypothetical protein
MSIGNFAHLVQGGVMKKLEALQILEAKLGAVEQEHRAEFAGNNDTLGQADAKAEAKALAAVFDFLRDCKISQTDSLLRILERYLRKPRLDRAVRLSKR